MQLEKQCPLKEIGQIAEHLPTSVLTDIKGRIADWLAMGGQVDDPYIEQQLRYARRFVKSETA